MRAIGKNVIVRVFKEKSMSEGGLYLPHAREQKTLQAKVLSVGDDVTRVGEGDVVLYDQHAGFEITDEHGKECLVLDEDSIEAIIGESE